MSELDADLLEGLTPRQRDVLELVARGLTNAEIGSTLVISPTTVRTHMTSILEQLQVTNRTEAAILFERATAQSAQVEALLRRPAITVVPFGTPGLAGDPEGLASVVAFGLAQDLFVLFARWTWFPVIHAGATRGLDAGESSTVLGERLGARFIVRGGVRLHDDRLRVTARVDDAQTGHVLWADVFEIPRPDVLRAGDEIVAVIVAAAYPRLLRAAGADAARLRSADVAAWEVTHAGVARLGLRSRDATVAARGLFDRAVALDGDHMPAWYGIGLTCYDVILNQWGSAEAALDGLGATAERCVALEPDAAEGWFLRARHAMARGVFRDAAAPLRRAISLNPSFSAAHALLGQILLIAGDVEQGLVRMKHAARLGPGAYVAGLSVAHFCREEYDHALEAAEDALAANPAYVFAHTMATASAWWLGDRPGAAARFARLLEVNPTFCEDRFEAWFGGERTDAVERVARGIRGARQGL